MDSFLVSVGLPLTLAFIMFTLGFGLRIEDFLRVFKIPKAFAAGIVNQMVLLPLVGFCIAILFGLPAELAVGMMILALSPGGATTNVLSKIAGGNVPLSVSLTAVVTVISVITVPILISWSVGYFMTLDGVSKIDTTALSIKMAMMSVIPVALGMVLTAIAPRFIEKITTVASIIAVLLFAIIITLAIAVNIPILTENLATLGPAIAILIFVMLALGLITAQILQLSPKDGTTISIESGIQNGTMGVAVAAILAAQLYEGSTGIQAFAIPSAVYGAIMYIIVIPFVLWRRSKLSKMND